MRTCIGIGLAVAHVLAAGAVAVQEAPRLAMPIDCDPGRTCFIQHYVDIDEGAGARDFRCGSATYDGHKGVDFRVLSAAAARRGVAVLAAAPGTVKGVRDGMEDVFVRETGTGSVTDRECGNGVVIDHGAGWETQYCHLRRGSVQVKRGDKVERGQRLGQVGWSGLADFAHLHLSVRRDGKVVDPFTGRGPENACDRAGSGPGLWDERVVQAFAYRNGEIIGVGFAEREPGFAALELDHEGLEQPTAQSASLVVYARLINPRQGDRVRFTIRGPAGVPFSIDSEPVPRNRPIHLLFVTQRRGIVGSWPTGRYTVRAELIRDRDTIGEREETLELR